MKIIYGVQGTGNGHISRSKEVIKELRKHAQVDVLLSGTQHDLDLGIEVKYKAYGLGFTFGTKGGIDYFRSFKNAKLIKILSDIKNIPVEKYDLVISDFEPISAWSAKFKGVQSIALSHQACFLSRKTPRSKKSDYFAEAVFKWYAPCSIPLGLHFQQYDSFIFPPIIREEIMNVDITNNGHYTVYLPFFHESVILERLKKIDVRWEVFSKHYKGTPYTERNVTVHPVSFKKFVESFASCDGVLCGAGFETPAEALVTGKKLMVVPMKGQYEQACNAEALKRMGIFSADFLENGFEKLAVQWMEKDNPFRLEYESPIERIVEYIFEKADN